MFSSETGCSYNAICPFHMKYTYLCLNFLFRPYVYLFILSHYSLLIALCFTMSLGRGSSLSFQIFNAFCKNLFYFILFYFIHITSSLTDSLLVIHPTFPVPSFLSPFHPIFLSLFLLLFTADQLGIPCMSLPWQFISARVGNSSLSESRQNSAATRIYPMYRQQPYG